MPLFVKPIRSYEAVSVGVVLQTVLAAYDLRGEDYFLITLTNTSLTETFEGECSCSPDGVNQWLPELNDEFESIGPGVTRRMLIPGDRLYTRVVGNFVGGPDTLRLTTTRLRKAQRMT